MPRARALLWGSMTVGGGPRRVYLFRVEPNGLLAIRVGNPYSWVSLVGIAFVFYELLGSTVLGFGSILAGAAVGMACLGLIDRAIARGIATQPRERVLRSQMNRFLPETSLREGRMREHGPFTRLRVEDDGRRVDIAFRRPTPPGPRLALGSLVPSA